MLRYYLWRRVIFLSFFVVEKSIAINGLNKSNDFVKFKIVLLFSIGLCSLAGVILYAATINDTITGATDNIHYSLPLCVIGSALAILAGIILAIIKIKSNAIAIEHGTELS